MNNKYNFQSTDLFFKYLDDRIPSNIVPLIIGYEKCSATKEIIGPIRRSIYTLHIVTNGRGFFTIGNKKYTIKANQIFMIFPSETITYFPDKNNPWEYMWVEFNGLGAKNLCKLAHLSVENPVYTLHNPDIYIKEFTEMLDESKDDKIHTTLNVLSHLFSIFSMVIHEQNTKKKEALNEAETRMEEIVEYIEQNIGDSELSLNEISKYFYMNASYLSRKFKEAMGVNMSKYIISLRMRKAFMMLKTKQFSIAKIAETIGYSSPFYFSKEFKRYTKITPKQYMKDQSDH
ncbi:MAG: AraC family transcriptional regulator [Acholeplasmataceae bacterium]